MPQDDRSRGVCTDVSKLPLPFPPWSSRNSPAVPLIHALPFPPFPTFLFSSDFPINRANISFTLNARHLLSTTLDSTTRLWNYHTSQVVKTFSCPTTAGSSSANVPAKGDEEKAAEEGLSNERLGCASEYLVVPRALVGREMGGQGGEEREGREKEVWIVGGGEDGRVVAWDVQSRQVVLDMRCHEGKLSPFFALTLLRKLSIYVMEEADLACHDRCRRVHRCAFLHSPSF
jgi:hypothetical protein